MAVIRKFTPNTASSLQPIATGSTARIRLDPAQQANAAAAPFTQMAQGLNDVSKYAEKIFELDQAAEKKKREAIILSRSLDLETYFKTSPAPAAFDDAKKSFYYDEQQQKYVKHLHPSDNKPLETFSKRWSRVEADALQGVTGSRLKTQIRSALMLQEMKLRNSLGLDALDRTRKIATADFVIGVQNTRQTAVTQSLGDGNYKHITEFFQTLRADGQNFIKQGTLSGTALASLLKSERAEIAKQVINAWSRDGNKSYTQIANALRTGDFGTASATSNLAASVYNDILRNDQTLMGRIEKDLLQNASNAISAKAEKLEIADAKRQFDSGAADWTLSLFAPLRPGETRQTRVTDLRTKLNEFRTLVGTAGLEKEFKTLRDQLAAYEDGFAQKSDPGTRSEAFEMVADQTLTHEWLQQNKNQLDEADYSNLTTKMATIRSAAVTDGRRILKAATKYNLFETIAGQALLPTEKDQIRQDYNAAELELDEFIANNPRASRSAIRDESLRIAAKADNSIKNIIIQRRDRRLQSVRRTSGMRFKNRDTSNMSFEDIAKLYEQAGEKAQMKRILTQAENFRRMLGEGQ